MVQVVHSPQIGYSVPQGPTEKSNTNLSQVLEGSMSVALLGDSILARDSAFFTVSTTVWVPGRVTITTSLSHGLKQGSSIRYVGTGGSASTALNGVYEVYSITSATVFVIRDDRIKNSGSTSSADSVSDLDRNANTGILAWANAFSGQRFNLVYNGAVGGTTTSVMKDTLNSEILALSNFPRALLIMGGVNDTSGVVASTVASVADSIYDNLVEIAELASKYGMAPIISTILPVASGLTNATLRQACINRVNQKLDYYGAADNDVVVVDLASAIMDYSTGHMLASCVSTDGSNIHLAPLGAKTCGRALADFMGKDKGGRILTRSVLDNKNANANNLNLVDNAPWVSSGGSVSTGCSGTAAQGFQVIRTAGTGTAVASVVARNYGDDGDSIGFNQKLAISFAGGTDTFDMRLNQGTDSAIEANFEAGKSYELRMAMRVVNVQGGGFKHFATTFTCNLTDSVSGFAYTAQLDCMTVSATATLDSTHPIGPNQSADIDVILRSRPFTVPTAVTGSNGTGVRITFSGSGALTAGNPPVEVYVGRVSIVEVS